jgi:hypothetical protein
MITIPEAQEEIIGCDGEVSRKIQHTQAVIGGQSKSNTRWAFIKLTLLYVINRFKAIIREPAAEALGEFDLISSIWTEETDHSSIRPIQHLSYWRYLAVSKPS